MNIFVLDIEPERAAKYHYDRHVVKMVLETAQILSSARHKLGLPAPYRATHSNHPVVKWACESIENYAWLFELGLELADEYTYRYGKKHKSGLLIQEGSLEIPTELPKIHRTPFALCMPDEYKDDDPVTAYRNYYIHAKSHVFGYTKRNIPEWLEH